MSPVCLWAATLESKEKKKLVILLTVFFISLFAEEKYNTVTYEEDGDVFIERSTSSPSNSSRASISSTASIDEDGSGPSRQRRTSVYEQKQIQAPSSMRGKLELV